MKIFLGLLLLLVVSGNIQLPVRRINLYTFCKPEVTIKSKDNLLTHQNAISSKNRYPAKKQGI
ncbi:MAG: hypothetical protein EA361_14420 [Bacteroidetes bacterium]|nr:MAG: hypothetical protein EA361_14420 [Bacteroidota bacterium]